MKRWAMLTVLLALLTGCGDRSVLVVGSSCMGRMMSALAEGYAEQGKGRVEVQLGGTELGLLSLKEGGSDLASCSREPDGIEGIEAYPVAIDAIAVVVHRSNPVNSLTREQLRQIYVGEITDWSELGGAPRAIVVIGREAGSGTRHAFERGIGLDRAPSHAQEQNETGMLRTAVSLSPGAIGYLSFDYAGEETGVRVVSVEGILPGPETVESGRYPLTRRFYLCTRKGERREETMAFLRFCLGEEGQALIRSLGILDIGREGGCI